MTSSAQSPDATATTAPSAASVSDLTDHDHSMISMYTRKDTHAARLFLSGNENGSLRAGRQGRWQRWVSGRSPWSSYSLGPPPDRLRRPIRRSFPNVGREYGEEG